MRMKFCKFIAFVLLCFQLILFQGCKTLFVNDPEKKAVKQQKKEDQEFNKAYAKIRKAHYKNPTRDTRKRMDKSMKKAKKRNKSKKSKAKRNCK